jgi:hypothetical protein
MIFYDICLDRVAGGEFGSHEKLSLTCAGIGATVVGSTSPAWLGAQSGTTWLMGRNCFQKKG